MAPSTPFFGLPKIQADILLIESHMASLISHIDSLLSKWETPESSRKTIFDLDGEPSILQDFNEIIGMNIELKFIFSSRHRDRD